MEPVSTSIIAASALLSQLGQAMFGSAQAEQKARSEAISGFGESQQSAMEQGAEKKKAALSTLMDAYRSSLGA